MLKVKSLLFSFCLLLHLSHGLPQCDSSPSANHVDRASSLVQMLRVRKMNSSISALPPLGLVKVHKTGGTTLMKIFLSLTSARGMTAMVPADGSRLGWPGPFPGTDNLQLHGDHSHKYDMLAGHAVFNAETWGQYMRPKPFFIAIFRDPMRQAVSAYNFFSTQWYWGQAHDNNVTPSWAQHLDDLEKMKTNSTFPTDKWWARFCNPQAHDLGWYEYNGGSTKNDNNATMIRQWIDSLQIGDSGSIFLTEQFDKGLVLLKKHLRVESSELAYIRENKGRLHPVMPSDEQRERLHALYPVDKVLYEHFNKTFWNHWYQLDAKERDQEEATMKLANSELKAKCKARECPLIWAKRGVRWVPRNDSSIKDLNLVDKANPSRIEKVPVEAENPLKHLQHQPKTV